MIAISPHDKRVLIAGLTALLTIIGGAQFAPRVFAWNAGARAVATSLVAALANEDASIRALPVTRDSLIAARVRLANLDSTILDEDSPALAAATLAELLSDAAETTKAQLMNVQVRTDSATRGVFVAVQAQASVTGDLAAVTNFISRLESGPKLVAVREFSISSHLDQAAAPGKQGLIRADLLIEGLARNQPSRERAKQ